MKRINIPLITLVFFSASFFLSRTSAYAQDQQALKIFRVTPIVNEIQLIPGKPTSYDITVDNLLPESLGMRFSIENFTANDEDNGITTSADSTFSPLLNWIKLSSDTIIMPENGHGKITVTITTPSNAHEGGYYATISVTPFYITHPLPHAPIVVSKVSTIILATVGELNYHNLLKKVTIPTFSFLFVNETSNVPLLLRVSNDYFTHFSAKPFLTITPLFGNEQTIELTQKHILPGKTRRWEENISVQSPWHLFYRAQLMLSVGSGEELFQDSYFFIIPLRMVIGVVSIISLLVVLFLLRNRVRKAVRVLFQRKSAS